MAKWRGRGGELKRGILGADLAQMWCLGVGCGRGEAAGGCGPSAARGARGGPADLGQAARGGAVAGGAAVWGVWRNVAGAAAIQ